MASTNGEQGLTKAQGNIIIGLLGAAVVVVLVLGAYGVFAALPKVERAVKAAEEAVPKIERAVQVTERLEERFQSFADEVQPVVRAGAGKTIEAIKDMDAGAIAEEGTEAAKKGLESTGNWLQRKLGDR